MLGGHATVGDRAFISGNCLVHQFVRVGPLAIMQGGSAASQDVPPFTIATGDNHICGLNIVGLRRAGFTLEDRMALKRLYHALFFSGGNLREAAAQAREQFANPHCLALVDFVLASRRGVCRHGRSSSRRQAEKQTADD
jgi:UDP-N-acetylglucosamine acyltransferase